MANEADRKAKRTPYELITASVLDQMSKPMKPWERPWARPGLTMPTNASTGRGYSGANVPVLWGSADRAGYPQNRWASFNQWKKEGASVRKGERGTPVLWFKMYEPKDCGRDAGGAGEDGEQQDVKRIPVARLSYVFNASQVDGAKDQPEPERVPLDERYANAERILKDSGATIRHGYTRAYYDRASDEIHMPDKASFKPVGDATALENYYSTAFHELTHWSGATDRMDRRFGKRFGDAGYAQEELTAELGSAFLCVRSGVTPTAREDHAQYLKSWSEVLKEDPKAFTRAASAAQKSSDYIMSRGLDRTQEQEHRAAPHHEFKVAQDTSYEFAHQHDPDHRTARDTSYEYAHQHTNDDLSRGR